LSTKVTIPEIFRQKVIDSTQDVHAASQSER
jgi:hypothetical protein